MMLSPEFSLLHPMVIFLFKGWCWLKTSTPSSTCRFLQKLWGSYLASKVLWVLFIMILRCQTLGAFYGDLLLTLPEGTISQFSTISRLHLFSKRCGMPSTPRIKFFMWLLVVDHMNTRGMLLRRNYNVQPNANCVMCSLALEEDIDHLFFGCPFALSY
jgi:hypothetical protein